MWLPLTILAVEYLLSILSNSVISRARFGEGTTSVLSEMVKGQVITIR